MKKLNRLWPLLLVFATTAQATNLVSSIDWRDYSPQAFEQAKAENRYVLLDLVAVWCHWCHVMEETTYQDPKVAALIGRKFIAVKVDHDARPDLAERYRDYGWPATIVLKPDGTELVKRAGYIPVNDMLKLLRRVSDRDGRALVAKTPLALSPELSETLRRQLKRRHVKSYDHAQGGLQYPQKFLDEGAVMWDLHLAQRGDQAAEQRARQYLDAAIKLIDPAFGGAYQYSTHGDWDHPHYEKIMRTQARYLRVYSQAFSQLKEDRYRQAAAAVAAYLNDFLSAPNGGFFTSQDADLQQGKKAHDYFALNRSERLVQGLPRIDKNQYAAENAMAIEGLVRLYQVTKDKKYLTRAVSALDWVLQHRRLESGFSHGAGDSAGPYLSDNLFMGRVFLALFDVTKAPVWLDQAEQIAQFMENNFAGKDGGLVSAVDNGTPVKPVPQLDLNLLAADFYIRLAKRTGQAEHQAMAAHVMRYLATDQIALSRGTDAGILLLDSDYNVLSKTLSAELASAQEG